MYIHLQDSEIHIYTVNGDSLCTKTTISNCKDCTVVAYSPDGQLLAVTVGKTINIFDSANYKVHPSFNDTVILRI